MAPKTLHLQVMDHGLNLGVMLRSDELGGLQEFQVPLIDLLWWWAEHVVPEQPVGDIDVGLTVGSGGVLLQDRRDGHAQFRILGQLLQPFIVAIDIREGNHFPALQDQESVIDLGLAAGGQPKEPGHQTGADDGRLL